jgi:hypothetical protein
MLRTVALALALSLSASTASAATSYDPRLAGHPMRVAAYVLHPAGWLIDRVLFFPAWWIGQHEPMASVFGVAQDRASGLQPRPPQEESRSGLEP